MTDREFIEKQRSELELNIALREITYRRELVQALSRLEAAVEKGEKLCVQNGNLLMENQALVKANEDRDLTPKNLEEFRLKLFNDPVAYAYYNMGAAVERDKQLSPEERTRKNWDAIYSAISCGFEKKILPDIWTAEFASVDKAEKDAKEGC